MNQKKLMTWFCAVSFIGILFGMVYCFLGLKILPVNKNVLIDWESSIYGAVMIGWGVTAFLLGRLAFRRKDKEIMKILLLGLTTWLAIEAIFSIYHGVYFNSGVDAVVFILFAIPLIKGIRSISSDK